MGEIERMFGEESGAPPITFGSLFAGVGGFDLGFERAGMHGLWQVENDPYPIKVLEEKWPDVPRWRDVSTFDPRGIRLAGQRGERQELARQVPSVDRATSEPFGGVAGEQDRGGVLGDSPTSRGDETDPRSRWRPTVVCGGFPCQDVSVAGRRAGLAGARSGLWWEFHRVLREARPLWAVIENVPGLLSSNRGRDLGAILGALGDLGYGFAWRVLDAQNFGVPQRRRRLFLVGRLGSRTGAAEVLLEPEGGEGGAGAGGEAWAPVAALTANGLGGGGPDDNLAQAGHLIADVIPFDTTQISSALNYSNPKPGDPCHPLAAGAHPPQVALPDLRVRKLTPLECERLQGFPDGWTDSLSDTRRHKALGNAVAVPVTEWLGRRIVAWEQAR